MYVNTYDIPSKANASPFKLFDGSAQRVNNDVSGGNRLIVSWVFPTSARRDYTKVAERTVRGLIISQRCENFLFDSRFDLPSRQTFNLILQRWIFPSLSFDLSKLAEM